MKIVDVNTYSVEVPLGERTFLSSQALFPARNSFLVEMITDEGIIGWGEGGQYGPAAPVAACVDEVLKARIVGENPLEPVRVSEQLYAFSRDFGQKGTYIEAISALDIAMWDIAGKYYGQPIATLIGGVYRSTVAAYATGFYYSTKEYETKTLDKQRVENEVAQFLTTGFNNVKVKIGLLDLNQDVEKIRLVRERIGPDRGMFVDSNHAYNVAGAKDLLRRIEEYGIGFVEEPLPPEDRAGYASLRQFSPIPIAAGECEFTSFGFRDLIDRQCVDILQPDLCASGGYSEFIKIRSLAYANNILLVPHVWGSAIGLSAALQAIAHLPNMPHTAAPIPGQNAPMIEFDQSPNPLRTDIVEEDFRLEDGFLKIPQGPGLGVTVKKEKIEQYCR